MLITDIFERFNSLSALVIGDVMIDNYFWGKVDRISPEAPVPIVSVTRRESRMGGAANVAINIQALGAKPILCSVLGKDNNAELFESIMQQQNLNLEGLIKSNERLTTVKTRVIGNNHQMLRVDEEEDSEISQQLTQKLFQNICSIINNTNIDVIIFEDYDKGVINASLIQQVVEFAKRKGIPVTADPKTRNFAAYQNITLLKPNLKELKEGLKMSFSNSDKVSLIDAVKTLQERQKIDTALVTLSEQGLYISNHSHQHHIPAHIRNIADVSGAGDTVISVASLCLALNLDLEHIGTLSNLAGGLVCEKIGVSAIDKMQLLQEAKPLYS